MLLINYMKQEFKITNLTCEACIKLSTMALKKIPGVYGAKVDLASGKAEIESEWEISWNEIAEALAKVDKIAAQAN